jgi:FkbM family methyltransferase
MLILFSVFCFYFFFNFKKQIYCKKFIDKTEIKLIHNKQWENDFCGRFTGHEKYTNIKLKELLGDLPNRSYVIDVGGHVGDTGLYLALILKNKYPEKQINVIIIEPDITKINFIKDMAHLNNLNNVILLNYGISDKKTDGKLLINNGNQGATKMKEEVGGGIKVDTIDNLCNQYKVSLMHIDVEGMEYQCLIGSKNTLKNTKYVMIELNKIVDRNLERQFLKDTNFKEIEDNKIYNENNNVLFVKI